MDRGQPFLARLIWGRRPMPAQRVDGTTRGFLFFNPRGKRPHEEQKLHAGYTPKMRQPFEPRQTPKFNDRWCTWHNGVTARRVQLSFRNSRLCPSSAS
jgi:hypothetical protein